MQYVMKQKLLAWGDDYYIKDKDGKDVYFVDGKAFSIGEQLSFQDLGGNQLAFIKQRVWSWGKTFEISHSGVVVATVKNDPLVLVQHQMTIEFPGPDANLDVQGSLGDHEYLIRRGGDIIATVSKKWFTLADTYGIDVRSSEDQVLLLAIAVVIDETYHGDGRRN